MKRITSIFIVWLSVSFSLNAYSACSPYVGLVTINEASKEKQNPSNNNGGDDADDFVEIKLLDASIPASVYNTWNLQICENSATGCNTIPVSSFDVSGSPWLVIRGLTNVGRHLNFAVGTDILLTDANGDAIDYLSTGGFNNNQPVCTFIYDTVAVTASSTRRVKREPDGSGDWDVPTGNSEADSESTTNDDVPNNAPSMSLNDVTVAAGQTATFTISLNATFTSAVNVSYTTLNNSAVAGSDYIAASGTATILAGATSTTVSVATFANGSGRFFLSLSGADNAIIVDQLGEGIIIPNPTAEYRLDEANWTGSFGEVVDESGNGLDGRARNGADTANTDPALSGSPGTCGYGDFDGNNDLVEVADNNALDFTNELTLTAWVYPETQNVTRAIVTKGGTFTYSYRLHINSSNRLEFTWCRSRNIFGVCSSDTTIASTATIPTNTWTHVAVSFRNGAQQLYINGVADGNGSSGTSISPSNTALTFGGAFDIFGTAFELNGRIDEIRLYDISLDQSTINAIRLDRHACAGVGVDHYGISFDGGTSFNDSTGLTCDASAVTIVGHDGADTSTAPGSGTTIQLSTSTGEGFWSSPSIGSLINNGNGNASYTFATNSAVTLQLNHPIAANNVNININAGLLAPSEAGDEDPSIDFFDTGFRFINASDVAIIDNQVAAQTSPTYALQAVRTDTQTGSCVALFGNGEQRDVQLAAECNNPLTCAGGAVVFNNNGNSINFPTSDDNGNVGAATYASFNNVLFGADSKANFTFSYPDAGAISLHARFDIPNEDGSASGVFMQGTSNTFVVSPATFVVTQVNVGAVNNPATTNTGTGFVAAGTTFSALVEARNATGNITPNYGNEIIPESVRFNFNTLVYPVGGNVGVLASGNAFVDSVTEGVFVNNNLSWSEVGSFTGVPQVADGDYLGTGNVVGAISPTIGRFYPNRFVLNSGSITNSCVSGGFSYLAQPEIAVSYQLEAQNIGTNRVLNYDNLDLNYVTAAVTHALESNNDGVDRAGRLNLVLSNWDDGRYTLVDTSVSVHRAADVSANIVPDGPLIDTRLSLSAVDVDGASIAGLDAKANDSNNCTVDGDCSSKLLNGSLNLRFGRLRLENVHGPESAAIPMVWQMEYWTGSQFVRNNLDQCSQLPLSAVNFVGATTVLDAVADTIAVTLGGVTSSFDFSDRAAVADCLSPTAIGFCSGYAGVEYGASGAIVSYPIDIDLSAAGLSFMRGDWNQDGSYNDLTHPRIEVRFEQYRGNDRIIFWREVLE